MKNVLIQTRVSKDIKDKADKFFKSVGISTPTALRMLLLNTLKNETFTVGNPKLELTDMLKTAIKESKNEKNLTNPMEIDDAINYLHEL